MSDQSLDELDNVFLKERLRCVLSSKSLELQSKKNSSGLSPPLPVSESSHKRGVKGGNELDHSWGIQRNDDVHASGKRRPNNKSNGRNDLFPGSVVTTQGSSDLNIANIKVEPQNFRESQSVNVTSAAVMSFSNFVTLKKEVEISDDLYGDEFDHMLLRDRMKLLSSDEVDDLKIHQTSDHLIKSIPSVMSCDSVAPRKHIQPLKVNRPRKKRKTVTDSIETAMEEDAPGLLKVLMEKGVSVNEIKLYGEPENNDDLDDSSSEDKFSELEVIIAKLFTQHEPLLKLGPLRSAMGEKSSYCLACLFSLVEQARYLKFRNWPVEWGWCRDLQSFIFIFVKHNRIVLERPEYGYATYFFELVASLPVHWQIKRLVTVMKLTSCSRITILENKALMVGDDLTEGEAKVLTEFGWLPNTGIASMLNYCDRVVHDRRNEKDNSEWSTKIQRLLMDGYNGGTIMTPSVPSSPPHVKPEPAEG